MTKILLDKYNCRVYKDIYIYVCIDKIGHYSFSYSGNYLRANSLNILPQWSHRSHSNYNASHTWCESDISSAYWNSHSACLRFINRNPISAPKFQNYNSTPTRSNTNAISRRSEETFCTLINDITDIKLHRPYRYQWRYWIRNHNC